MANQYGLRNRYVPTALAPRAYGWRRRGYVAADVPTALANRPTNVTSEQFRQQFAYEWLNSSEIGMGYSNPPFFSGAAGRIPPGLFVPNHRTGDGGETNNLPASSPPRITRGFIRRSETEANDEKSKARLYFMYNPEVITREYQSYLDQSALDPFNTVYQSGNLVAPPSILDFTFSLFFDRQEEAQDASHPGIFVDYQFFDLVVRNVVPAPYDSTGRTLPDSGVMMVNPREITVIFSPQLTVQGRPLNARVNFLKFTHKMVPTRMAIDLTIRATYFGPTRPQSEYVREQFSAQDTIPYRLAGFSDIPLTFEEETIDLFASDTSDPDDDGTTNSTPAGRAATTTISKAMEWIRARIIQGTTQYDVPRRDLRMIAGGPEGEYFPFLDCSSLVCRAFQGIGAGNWVGAGKDLYGSLRSTHNFDSDFVSSSRLPAQVIPRSQAQANPGLIPPGALLLGRNGVPRDHVVLHEGWYDASGKYYAHYKDNANITSQGIIDAASKGSSPQVGFRKRNYSTGNYGGTWSHVVIPTGPGGN